MANLRQTFQTDEKMEREGFILDFGDAGWFRIARAGGANDRFTKLVEQKMKPYRRQIEQETLPAKVAKRLTYEAIAEGIVLSWGHPKYVELDEETGQPVDPDDIGEGMMAWEDDDGNEVDLPFDPENVAMVLTKLPDLATAIQQEAMKAGNFKSVDLDADAKN